MIVARESDSLSITCSIQARAYRGVDCNGYPVLQETAIWWTRNVSIAWHLLFQCTVLHWNFYQLACCKTTKLYIGFIIFIGIHTIHFGSYSSPPLPPPPFELQLFLILFNYYGAVIKKLVCLKFALHAIGDIYWIRTHVVCMHVYAHYFILCMCTLIFVRRVGSLMLINHVFLQPRNKCNNMQKANCTQTM